ncbi:MAG: flavodoxin domain-containing protein [Methanocella sp.]
MKTLVAYATNHGATKDYAEALARELPGEVTLVDLKAKPDCDLAPFDTVVLGAAIYAGQAPKALREFCARNLEALKQKRLGLFICCWFVDQAEKELQAAFPAELLGTAVAKEAFGGRIDLARLTFFERLISKVVGVKESCSRYSEDAARSFAQALKRGLLLLLAFVLTLGLTAAPASSVSFGKAIKALKALKINDVDLTKVKDGEYEGDYDGELVKAKVRVKVAGGRIVDLVLLKHETGLGGKAKVIVKRVVQAQSLAVDTVSGATHSSKVILKATELALKKGIAD